MSKLYGPYECVKPFRGMGGVLYNVGDKPVYLHRLAAQAKLQTGHIAEIGEVPEGVSFTAGNPGLTLDLERPENPYVKAKETKSAALESGDESTEESQFIEPVDYTTMIAEAALESGDLVKIRQVCEELGLPVTGNKKVLTNRLIAKLVELKGE